MIGAAVLILGFGATSRGGVDFETIAYSGQEAPGTGPGVSYSFLGTPYLDDGGDLIFSAFLTGNVMTSNNRGVWLHNGSGTTLVARRGDPAPDILPVVFFSSSLGHGPLSNQSGHFTLFSNLVGTGINFGNNEGMWVNLGGDHLLVHRKGEPAPGTSAGVVYGDLIALAFNNSDQLTYWSQLAGTGVNSTNDGGIWLGVVGNMQLMLRKGEPAPGYDPGITVRSVDSPRLSASGQAVLGGRVEGPDITFVNNSVIWTGGVGDVSVVARAGQTAPGVTPPTLFTYVNVPTINAADTIAFSGYTLGDPKGGYSDGIWSTAPGPVTLVAYRAEPAADLPGLTYDGFVAPQLMADGRIAFMGLVAGPGVDENSDDALWVEATTGIRSVYREGEPAPGAGAALFGWLHERRVALNDAGQVAFVADLAGPGVNSTNDAGLWATDGTVTLCKLLRKGDSFAVAPGDGRVIDQIHLAAPSESGNGLSRALSNDGRLALDLGFTDGTGAVVLATLLVSHCAGDINGDGTVNGLDIAGFVDCVTNDGCCWGSDMDGDGIMADVDWADDLPGLVARLLEGVTTCP